MTRNKHRRRRVGKGRVAAVPTRDGPEGPNKRVGMRPAAAYVRLIDKSFFTLMQHWSGAVMCPAC